MTTRLMMLCGVAAVLGAGAIGLSGCSSNVTSAIRPVNVETGGVCEETEECRREHECVDGVCLLNLAQPCAGSGDCVSGHCVDDLCCQSACAGQCEGSCDAAGTCQPASAGTACDDSDPCTVGDGCGGFVCTGDVDISCLGSDLLGDVTVTAGVAGTPDGTDWGEGYGIAWGDYDNDGFIDLWVGVEGPPDGVDDPLFFGHLFHNDGDGTFTEITPHPRGQRSGAWADADNDGDLDIFTSNGVYGATITDTQARLAINEGGGAFLEVTDSVGLGNVDNVGTAAWLDANADGHIDLFVPNGEDINSIDPPPGPNELRLNTGATPVMFTTYTDPGLADGEGNGETCTVADVDNDGDIDIWYNDQLDGSLYLNDGAGVFTEASAAAGLAIDMGVDPDDEQPYYAPVFGDYDNDGWLDLFLGHPDGIANRLYRNRTGELGDLGFELQTGPGSLNEDLGHSRGAAWGDFDNDGDLDLLVGNEQHNAGGTALEPAPDALYENRGAAGFVDIAGLLALNLPDPVRTMSVSFADYDNDGDLDIFFTSDGSPSVLWRNALDDDKHLKVSAVGRGAGYSSRDGIGTRIELWNADETSLLAIREVSGGEGYGSQSSRIVHFGLAGGWGGGGATYTLKARFVSGAVVTVGAVVPSAATLTVGSTTLNNAIEIAE